MHGIVLNDGKMESHNDRVAKATSLQRLHTESKLSGVVASERRPTCWWNPLGSEESVSGEWKNISDKSSNGRELIKQCPEIFAKERGSQFGKSPI